MREKLVLNRLRVIPCRITPACAGKTLQIHLTRILYWDHPRECGKNAEPLKSGKQYTGSPPRVREKLQALNDKLKEVRDHPRECGKNHADLHKILSSGGSPPRVREKPSYLNPCRHAQGITPASAGKTDRCPITLE